MREPEARRRDRRRALQLFGLCGFALAQPLFDVLGRGAEIFVAQRIAPGEIVGITLGLILAPPALLLLVQRLARAVAPALANALHVGCIVGLATLTLAPLLYRAVALPELFASVLALALGGAFGLAYRRVAWIEGLLDLSALAPLAFAGLFLGSEPIRSLLVSEEVASPGAAAPTPSDRTSVVLVVFDELPLSSLLDAGDHIDPLRFPAFASLAEDATWFTNASGSSVMTPIALPALLTGRQPPAKPRLPTAASYPENLFSLLAETHTLNVHERITLLHPAGAATSSPRDERLLGMAADLSIVYLHIVLPDRLRAGLPDVTTNWGDFAQAGDTALLRRLKANRNEDRRRRGALGEALRFGDFTRSVGRALEPAGATAPSLHFIHSLLPHGPWHLMPSGAAYEPRQDFGLTSNQWSVDPASVEDGYRRHLLQLMRTDRLLGELVEELKRVSAYDSTLLIVTSDHGASFWPGRSKRWIRQHEHPADLTSVPLLVKRPGERRGQVDRRLAESIDIVPTIADATGVEPPWPLDGCSLLRPACAERTEQTVLDWGFVRRSFVLDGRGSTETLARKLELFGDGRTPRRLHASGPFAEWVGRPVGERVVAAQPAGRLSWDDGVRARLQRGVPARLVGVLEGLEPGARPPQLVVAVAGEVEFVGPAARSQQTGELLLLAVLREAVVGRAADQLAVYRVDESSETPRLISIELD